MNSYCKSDWSWFSAVNLIRRRLSNNLPNTEVTVIPLYLSIILGSFPILCIGWTMPDLKLAVIQSLAFSQEMVLKSEYHISKVLKPNQMKAVFSAENYVPQTIYLSLELICEMRWSTPKHCNLLVCFNVCGWQGNLFRLAVQAHFCHSNHFFPMSQWMKIRSRSRCFCGSLVIITKI